MAQTKDQKVEEEQVAAPALSPLEQRMADAFASLEAQVTKAEEEKGKAKPVSDFARVIGGVLGKVSTFDEEANSAIAAALGTDGIGLLVTSVDSLRALATALGGKGEDADREAGDMSANSIRALVTAHLLDPAQEETATALLARWDATKPGKARKSGGSSSTDTKRVTPLGFSVRITCQEVGCDWSASCSKDDLNSIRRQGQVHARDKHQNVDITRGHESHKMLTEALGKVMHDGSASQDGGKFIVSKVAD